MDDAKAKIQNAFTELNEVAKSRFSSHFIVYVVELHSGGKAMPRHRSCWDRRLHRSRLCPMRSCKNVWA